MIEMTRRRREGTMIICDVAQPEVNQHFLHRNKIKTDDDHSDYNDGHDGVDDGHKDVTVHDDDGTMIPMMIIIIAIMVTMMTRGMRPVIISIINVVVMMMMMRMIKIMMIIDVAKPALHQHRNKIEMNSMQAALAAAAASSCC